jgi:hypothetical protein
VQLLSSLLDVPAQLALVLSLAASSAGNDPPSAPPPPQTAVVAAQAHFDFHSLEGPFRFSEGIWLRALREGLPAGEGQADYSGRIFKTSSGRFYVPSAAERRRILDARLNAALAKRVAETFAQNNALRMRAALRRRPTAGDLYIAHVFGPEAAISFIELVDAKPQEIAARQMPELAQSAPGLLYDAGAPLTLAQVYKRLTNPMRKYARSAGVMAAMHAQAKREDSLPLKPTLAEASQSAATSTSARPATLAWRAEVSLAGNAAPNNPPSLAPNMAASQ